MWKKESIFIFFIIEDKVNNALIESAKSFPSLSYLTTSSLVKVSDLFPTTPKIIFL